MATEVNEKVGLMWCMSEQSKHTHTAYSDRVEVTRTHTNTHIHTQTYTRTHTNT